MCADRWLREKTTSGAYGISRPYAEPFLQGVPPGDDVDASDAWRWEREKKCFNERIYDAIKSLLDNGKTEDGVVFLKHISKFSYLFDFETNFETEFGNNDAKHWKEQCLQLISDNNIEVKHRHVLLIRDPLSVLGSWMGKSGDVHGNNPHPDEVGITQLLDVYSKVLGSSMNRDGEEEGVVCIDSDDLAANPRESLQELCAALGIEYRDSMLKWESGEHKCDGPWSDWWYHVSRLLFVLLLIVQHIFNTTS